MSNYLGFTPTKKEKYYFISYNSEDAERIAPIAAALSNAGIDLWYDYGLEYGEKWEPTIARKIRNCRSVILFFTKDILSKESSFVRKEFKIATMGFRKKIYVVLMDDISVEDVPDDKMIWWMDILDLQCINAFSISDTSDLIATIVKATGDTLQGREKEMVSDAANKQIDRPVPEDAIAGKPVTETIPAKLILKNDLTKKEDFCLRRYHWESAESNYVLGVKAYNREDYQAAGRLFLESYQEGNLLSGTKLGLMYWNGTYSGKRNYEKAVELLQEGLKYHNPLAAFWVAKAYRAGKGVEKNPDKAKNLFASYKSALESMCSWGDADAQYTFGCELLYGDNLPKDEKKAYYWLDKARKAGYISAGVQIAKILINGWGQKRDEKTGIAILDSYSNTNNHIANFELGKLYCFGELKEKDYQKALYHFKKAAEHGHAGAQDYLGDLYYYGEGVPVDYSEARRWYELSEQQGDQDAALYLGFIFYYGRGIPEDKHKAFKYFKESADKGNDRAQYMLHYYYFYDDNFKDYKLGRYYLEKSAEQGDLLSQKLLIRCYSGSFGFTEDDENYVYWLRKAADQNDAEAQRLLGEAYINLENEKILPKSYPAAIEWLEKACSNGDAKAAVLLAEIYTTENRYKDSSKFDYYTKQAERLMEEQEKSGSVFASEHKSLADLYYNSSSNKSVRQKAFDHYCRAFFSGQQSALFFLGWMYLINGYSSEFLSLSTDELIQEIKKNERTSESYDLSYLLGTVYFDGYTVSEDKWKGEFYYLRAADKGATEAAVKLGYYYIKEKIMNKQRLSVLEKAYDSGSTEAALILGICYLDGIGVKKDRSKGKSLVKEAANKGNQTAKKVLAKFLF